MFSSQNIRQSGIVVDCWQYTYSYEILKWFVNQRVKSRIDLEFFSTRKLTETFVESLRSLSRSWRKQKVKITVFQIIFFSIDLETLDPLFTHLWILSMAFVLMQVKTGFAARLFNYMLPFLYKSGIISIIYQKYGE